MRQTPNGFYQIYHVLFRMNPLPFLTHNKIILTKYFLVALFFTAFLTIIISPTIAFPSYGLDASWNYAINQAIANHLDIGKDSIFTAGPYSAIYTHLFHPATNKMILLGGIYFSLCCCLCLTLLSQNIKLRWGFSFLAMLVILDIGDSFYIAYPLIASLVVFRICFSHKNAGTINLPKHILQISLFAIFSIFGLLCLIKGSLLIPCIASLALSCFTLLYVRKNNLAAIIAISPIPSLIFFWIEAQQLLSNLPIYFFNMTQVILGHNEAMSVEIGGSANIIAYGIMSAAILYVIFREKSLAIFPRFLLATAITIFLFICFKGGFVRHDEIHNWSYCAASGLLVALLLPFIFEYQIPNFLRNLNIAPLPIIAVIIYAFIYGGRFPSPSQAFEKIINQAKIYQNLKERIFNQDQVAQDFATRILTLKEKAALPILAGRSDIYPFDQSDLIASGNIWAPRPVFQSYLAYTKKLAQLNADYLLSENAPQNIFFKIATFDERIPALDDGLSWPILLQNYTPIKMVNEFLLLQKKSTHAVVRKNISSSEYGLDEIIEIPNSANKIIFADFEIKLTLIGRLLATLFRPSQLQIAATLSDGSTKIFRIHSTTAKAGFIISPLIENIEEFRSLFDKDFIGNKTVKSFTISNRSAHNFFWKSRFKITFSSIL